MQLFESVLMLSAIAILLQVSRRFEVPYPTTLALAGVVVAPLSWAPYIRIDPQLALALFVAPALTTSSSIASPSPSPMLAPNSAPRPWN